MRGLKIVLVFEVEHLAPDQFRLPAGQHAFDRSKTGRFGQFLQVAFGQCGQVPPVAEDEIGEAAADAPALHWIGREPVEIPGHELGAGIARIRPAAANLTITPERQRLVDFSDPWLSEVSELVVTGPAAPDITSLDDLVAPGLQLRRSSSYFEHLTALNEGRERSGKPAIPVTEVDENLEDEDLLQMMNAGLIPAIVVDSHKAAFWAQIFEHIVAHEDLALNTGGRIAWAFRKDSLIRYFKIYADQYDFDWLMIGAQAYQESRLDQSKRSPVGAVGVKQVMPDTARDPIVGIPDISEAEPNIHAGVKYLRFLRDRYFSDPGLLPVDRTLFSFAAYNAGPGNIAKARKRAEQMGFDPNLWFGNVEVAAAKIISREPVHYVRNIYKYYIAYRSIREHGNVNLDQTAGDAENAKQGAPP